MDHAAPDREAAGRALVLTAAVLWGTLGVLSTALFARGVAPLEVALFRALFGGAGFALHAVVTRARAPRGRDLAWTIAFGLVGISAFYGALQLAIRAGGASLAVILLYTAPAMVAGLAWAVLGQRPTRRTLALIGCTIAGVTLVSIGGGHGVTVTPRAVALGLASGACYATYYLFGKTVLARNPAPSTLAIALGVGAAGLAPFVELAPRPAEVWGLLAAAGVATTYLAVSAYAAGVRRLDPTRASILASVEPVIAVGLAVAVLGERLSPVAVGGAALVVAAVVIAGRT